MILNSDWIPFLAFSIICCGRYAGYFLGFYVVAETINPVFSIIGKIVIYFVVNLQADLLLSGEAVVGDLCLFGWRRGVLFFVVYFQ